MSQSRTFNLLTFVTYTPTIIQTGSNGFPNLLLLSIDRLYANATPFPPGAIISEGQPRSAVVSVRASSWWRDARRTRRRERLRYDRRFESHISPPAESTDF